MGTNLKLRKMVHRMIASYLRAVVTLVSALSLTSSASKEVNLAFFTSLLLALGFAFIGPVLVFLTEAADLLDNDNLEPAPPKPDRGESTIMVVVLVLAGIALLLYIFNNR